MALLKDIHRFESQKGFYDPYEAKSPSSKRSQNSILILHQTTPTCKDLVTNSFCKKCQLYIKVYLTSQLPQPSLVQFSSVQYSLNWVGIIIGKYPICHILPGHNKNLNSAQTPLNHLKLLCTPPKNEGPPPLRMFLAASLRGGKIQKTGWIQPKKTFIMHKQKDKK